MKIHFTEILKGQGFLATNNKGRGAVPAHHGVYGLHPGLQLFLVWGLEQALSPVTSFNLQITEYQNENYKT